MNNDFNFDSAPEMPQIDLTPNDPNTGKGQAVTSFVLALVSILLAIVGCCCLHLIAAIVSIVFACVAKKKAGTMPKFAKAGLIISIIVIVITILLFVAGVFLVIEIAQNPDGEVAHFLDPFVQEQYGMTIHEFFEAIESGEEITIE